MTTRRRIPYQRYSIIFGGLLLLTLAGTTIAWLTELSSATNSFDIGEVGVTVTEQFDNYTKTDVAVENTSNIPVYVRAVVVATLLNDTTHQALGEEPVVGRDYDITYSNSANWQLGSDGYYYYLQPLAAGDSTDNLIDQAEQLIEYSDRTLHVNIAAQAIQATPTAAVEDAWGVTVLANGTLSP